MRFLLGMMLVTALTGCHVYGLNVEQNIVEHAAVPVDVMPVDREIPSIQPVEQEVKVHTPAAGSGIVQVTLPSTHVVGAQEKKITTIMDRLKVKDLPGADAPEIKLPGANAPRKEVEAAIAKQFSPLPKALSLPEPSPGPGCAPLTLADLQQLAIENSPQIRQAHHDIDAARGVFAQAGLYPNPTIGYEGDTIGQSNGDGKRSAGQQGGYIDQLIKTAGKLNLAKQAAQYEIEIAEQKLRQTEADLRTQIRAKYFVLLAAKKNFDVTRSLVNLTDEVYGMGLLQLQAGEVAVYEPMQTRVLALQARGTLVQAHNRYVSAWKRLAAAMGTPTMTLTQVAGRIDMPVPRYEHDAVLSWVVENHTDIGMARFGVEKSRALVRMAETQAIPDIFVHIALQKDMTAAPYRRTNSVQVGIPLPIFDRNQGAIHQARALLRRAMLEDARVRNDLTGRVAEVIERYENNRMILEMYKKQMLPNQVQAYRAAVARHAVVGEKNVSYTDLVTAQQSLAGLINSYLGALNEQWVAVVDIGGLMQTNDIFRTGQVEEITPVPDVNELRQLR
ncbi:MAG: TolC family protein [Gemmataceae bacterium]|nr:TolC family protein [Gemmataceae bacterium]